MAEIKSPLSQLLSEIEQARAKATQGIWEQELFTRDGSNDPMPNIYIGMKCIVECVYDHKNQEQHIKDAAYISEAANKILLLTQIIKMQDEALEEIIKSEEVVWQKHPQCKGIYSDYGNLARDTRNKINEMIKESK